MCLATVYKESDNTVICRNVSRIDVEGETVVIRDIMERKPVWRGKYLWWIWQTVLLNWYVTETALPAFGQAGFENLTGGAADGTRNSCRR